jgi:hypothetical protein
MVKNKNIRVPGYAQKVFFDNGIEYRNFSPDLVGIQLTSDSNTPLFTYGNFAITTNTEGRDVINYPTKPFSKAFTLNDITPNTQSVDLFFNKNFKVTLNIDNSKLFNFAYFGSATEFIRVTLESIIMKWPASLYIKPLDSQNYNSVFTVENYTHDSYYNTSTFKIKTNAIVNQYNIIYTIGGELLNTYDNKLRNLTVNYNSYVLSLNNVDYPIIDFTPSNNIYGDFIEIRVKGNPFPTAVNGQSLYQTYHIKPNSIETEKFFSSLEPFENYLLNRLTVPKYKSTFDYKLFTDNGTIYETSTSLVWPTSDGYNLDFDTNEYINYVTSLLEISTSSDETISNLMTRFLVSESISNFDTVPRCDGTEEETAGQKMNKTLKIYGRAFDEIKKYIDGIAYSNHVTYDKKNNAPDEIIKYIARVMGWQLTSSVLENDLLKTYLELPESTYPGQSRALSAAEAEIELWRRLILNSAWLFKSKGTRKAIEFLFKFIGAPQGLINLNEYVYVAKEKIDIDTLLLTLDEFELDTDLSNYNVDFNGFPKTFPNTPDMYFQKGGLWYRETGGLNSTNVLLEGNNPHIGPYDGGVEYINQFKSIIPNFEPTIITSSTVTTNSTQLFSNYNNGLINNYSGDTYIGIETYSGVTLDDCFLYESEIINDPHPENEETECGCELPTEDLALHINVVRGEYIDQCEANLSGYTYIAANDENFNNQPLIYNWNYLTYNIDGTVNNTPYVSPFISKKCCNSIVNGDSYLHNQYNINPETGKAILSNTGYICCKPFEIGPPVGPIFTDFGFPNDIKTQKTSEVTPLKTRQTSGCGCYLGCQWRLAGPTLGHMYSLGEDIYLKFVTPENNWGTTGTPNYRLGTEADGCICPTDFTTVQIVNDPYINKPVDGCKLNRSGREVLTLFSENNESNGLTIITNPNNGTINNLIYQLFYYKSIGTVGCTFNDIITPIICPIDIEDDIQLEINKSGVLFVLPINIINGVQPLTYEWIITSQSGFFSSHNFDNSNTLEPQILPPGVLVELTQIPPGSITIQLTVTDNNGCSIIKTTTFTII